MLHGFLSMMTSAGTRQLGIDDHGSVVRCSAAATGCSAVSLAVTPFVKGVDARAADAAGGRDDAGRQPRTGCPPTSATSGRSGAGLERAGPAAAGRLRAADRPRQPRSSRPGVVPDHLRQPRPGGRAGRVGQREVVGRRPDLARRVRVAHGRATRSGCPTPTRRHRVAPCPQPADHGEGPGRPHDLRAGRERLPAAARQGATPAASRPTRRPPRSTRASCADGRAHTSTAAS